MRNPIFISILALATASTLGVRAEAAGRDPLVIQGIGPEDAERRHARPAPRHMNRRMHRRDNLYRAEQPRRPARIAAVSRNARGQYGGGFIEFLITGNSGTGSESAAAPVRRVRPAPTPYFRPDRPQQTRPLRRSNYRRQALAAPEPTFRRRLRSGPVHPKFNRQEVAYPTKRRRGTIVVDTPNRFLYYVLGNGRAMRYGIGVGRPGFEWSGVKKITRKAQWPSWRPPASMRKRRPDLPKFMEGGPANPMGARALYLGSSLYRIHGTNEPRTIGTNVSSGCIRMMNKDVIDLYQRTRVGSKVIVI